MRIFLIFIFGFLLFSCSKQDQSNHVNVKEYRDFIEAHPQKSDSILKIVAQYNKENRLKKDDKIWFVSNVLPTLKDANERIDFLKKTIKEVTPNNDEIVANLPVLYNYISFEYYQKNDSENAIKSAFKGVEYALIVKKKFGLEKSNLEFSYYNLALGYRSAGDFVNYKKYLNLSLINSSFEDSKGYIFQNLGDYYLSYKQIDSAFYYTKMAKENYSKMNNKISMADISLNLATLYYEKQEYEKAKQELNPETLHLLIDSEIINAQHYALLGKIEVKLNNLQSAKQYLDKSLQLIQIDEEKINYYSALSDYYIKKGNLAASNEALINLVKYNDKYHDQLIIDKSKTLEKGFYLKQKDLQIKKLLLENQITSEKSKSKSILIFAILFLVLILGIFYYLFSKNKELKAENQRNILEQKLFASQMSPHFIFNALSAIQAEVLNNNTKEANLYLTKFGKLLQNVLLNTNQEYVTIASEYKNLINYIDLQKIRYKNFEYKLDVYEGITDDEDEIPPMLLQPLVENAIEHGIKTLEHGIIKIVIKKYHEVLQCQIIDNGIGLNSNSKSNNISTSLIKKRLKYLSTKTNEKLDLTIENNSKSGVTSSISISYKTKF